MSVTRVGSEFTITTSTGYNSNGAQITPLSNGAHLVDWIYGWDSVDPADSRARIYNASRTAVGNDFQVAADPSFYTDTTPLSNGNFVITWATSGADPEIKAQIYTNAGATVGSQVSVNTTTTGNQYSPKAIALEGGGFVIAWTDNEADLARAQIFTDAGVKVGSELTLATTAGQNFDPYIAALPGGGFVAAWTDMSATGGDTSGAAVRAQVFDASGTKVGAEFLVNTTTAGGQAATNVTVLANGHYVVFWDDLTSTGMRGQVFSGSGGTKVGSEFTVETNADSHTQNELSVVALEEGFVAMWWSRATVGSDTNGSSIRAQIFGDAGAKVGGEIVVNTTTAGDQILPNLAATPNGGFVVVWSDTGANTDGDGTAARAQVFRADGTRDGGEILVNTTTTGNQANPAVAATDTGFMIAWFDGNGVDSIRGQYFAVTIPPELGGAGGTVGFTENGAAVAVAPGLTVADVDSASLASATVSITGGFQTGQDVLAFTNSNATTFGNIAGSYDATTGVLTLTSSGATATLAQWQAVLRAVTYANSSEAPNTADRTISVTVNDSAETATAVTQTVTVTAVNDAPTVAGASGAAWTEGASPVAVASALVVVDADSANLSGATVSITGNFQSGQDVLAFTDQNGITGSYDAATGVLTLSGSATVAQYQAALRSVTYANGSDTPNTASRTLSFQVSDGTATSTAATETLTLTAVNDAPAVAGVTGTTAFTEGAAAVAIAPALTLSDADDTMLAGATVSVAGGFVAGEDVLAFVDQNGITGAYNGATGVLTLSGLATLADYQAALRSITFATSSEDPVTLDRTISFDVRDGSATSAAASRTVTVAAANDAPTLAGAGGATSYTENAAAMAVVPGLTVADADDATLAGATVSITAGFQAGADVLAFANTAGMGNIAGSYNAATGVLTLTSAGATATLVQWQAALRAVTYANTSDTPTTTARTVSVVVNDGAASSTAATRTLNVTAVNDAPAGADATVSILVGGTKTFAASDFGFTDPDGHTLASVTIATLPAAGALTLNGAAVTGGQAIALADIAAGRLVFTPGAAGATANYASFTFQVQDSAGGLDASANTLTVNLTEPPSGPPSPPPPPATGTSGNDAIVLDTTQRTYDGGAGDDSVTGSYMPDTLSGGDGNDSLSGGVGDDELSGGPGQNVLRGGDGQDVLTGGEAFDDLHGNIGDDTVRGGGGGDWVVGGQGQDRLFGDEGSDVVLGNLGEDALDGGSGDDVMRGGQGNDSVAGGQGHDWIAGDRGSDTLSGGAGADTFHTWGEAGLDVVVDFNAAEGDRVNLFAGTTYTVAQVGADTVISMTGGGQMVLQNVQLASLPAGWIL